MAGGVDSLAWALPAALSAAHGEREQAQGAIQACALLPGYCTRLLQLTAAFELGDSVRLLAATQLKNEILRRWCAGPRGIPEAERPVLREGLLARLATDEPCEQVGLQIGMTVARIMRSEANRGLGTVLQAFIDAMLQRQHLPPHALLALLHTAKELGTMRLPAQKLLAARVARLLLPSLSQQWSAELHAAFRRHGIAATAEARSEHVDPTAGSTTRKRRRSAAHAARIAGSACRAERRMLTKSTPWSLSSVLFA